jgi:hypothetical protein
MMAPFRTALSVGLLASCLAACSDISDVPNSDFAKVGVLIYRQILGGEESVPRERVAAIPYATLGVRLGSSDQVMFVLGSVSGGDLHWIGGKQFAITTHGGRIVRTVGFLHNLTGFQKSSPTAGATHDYLYDFAELNAYSILVRCSERDVGPERIVIVGYPHDTVHVAEDCRAAQLDWTFTNDFWKDAATGYVWKSQQYIQPDIDALTLESLRPAQE